MTSAHACSFESVIANVGSNDDLAIRSSSLDFSCS